MTSQVTPEENIFLQSYYTACLLTELTNNNLVDSQFFAEMHFDDPRVKEAIRQVGLDNQGLALMFLYALLVVPRELNLPDFNPDYSDVNAWLDASLRKVHTTYSRDAKAVDYVRHLRNAVSHARIAFRPADCMVFEDEDTRRGFHFSAELPLCHLGELCQKLTSVHSQYLPTRGDHQ